jgi:NADH:ubiquinone oxidoreductase subunit C
VSYTDLPGFVEEKDAFGETTVTIEPARIRDACAHARDELGFQMLVDVVATD